ncbi:MAG: D-alanyl-D-alanine carboxypeptidase [Clostridia bacterium]|nr:D-alanyl-D-alanine carboxypeptidase [Clostridia bacterium]
MKNAFRKPNRITALALILAVLATLCAFTPADGLRKAQQKDAAEAAVGPVYHLDAPSDDCALPLQRADIVPEDLPFMEDARSAVLIEAESGQKLLSRNPDERLPMASTTKTMTALVVLENCAPDEVLTVPDEAVGVEGSSLYLAYGERLTVRDLLYGLMLRSGNDCAVALAIHVGGSVEGFADMMNERAARLGLQNTHFVTPNGLHDEEHYTTAFELALIGAEALKNPVFREIVSTKYYTIRSNVRDISIKNKNTMLWDYGDCIGVKTGYTSQAGRCLLFAAERNGLTLVGCVLRCTPMFYVAPQMLDYGFENYEKICAVPDGHELASARITGTEDEIGLVSDRSLFILMKRGQVLNTEVRVSLDENASAPVAKGEKLGTAGLYAGGSLLGRVGLVSREAAASPDFRYYFDRLIRSFGFH